MSQCYLRLLVDLGHLQKSCPELLEESIWKPSGVSDIWVRVDPERPEIKGKRHAHLAHQKHISATNKQVAWNKDGTRHDAGRFDNGFKSMEMAKAAARIALKLPDDAILEQVVTPMKTVMLTESILDEELTGLTDPEFNLDIRTG